MRWTLIGLAVGASVTVWVAAAVIYATWLRHEAHKMARRQDDLSRSERFRALSPEAPRAAGLSTDHRRVDR